jgi:hypothetical protein
MRFKRLLKKLGKNLLAGLGGAIVGVIISVFYLLAIWLPASDAGLEIIALLPVMIILFSILGMSVGGVLGIVIYQVVRFIRKRSRK